MSLISQGLIVMVIGYINKEISSTRSILNVSCMILFLFVEFIKKVMKGPPEGKPEFTY